MNLVQLQRFMPLIGLAKKLVFQLSDDDLMSVAAALAGPAAEEFLPLLVHLREKEPDQAVSDILGSDTVKNLIASIKDGNDAAERVVFCRCPNCGTPFETEVG